ncbi:hypothetical protein ES703_59842 [subsurface metagenome]
MPTIKIANKDVTISQKLDNLFTEWENLAEEYFGKPKIPVEIISRYKVKQFKHFKGELNTALPIKISGHWTLIVAVENIDLLNESIVAHEVMHWIIRFYGFHDVQNKSNPNDDCTILLNCLTSHVPLNHFMAKRGFDYLPMENERAMDTAKSIFRNGLPKPPTEKDIIYWALYYSDLILSSSLESSNKLRLALKTCLPINTHVEQILSALDHYNLHKPDANKKAKWWLIKMLKLKKWGDFIDFNNLANLKQKLKESIS